jgi:hypothetical protein
MKDCLRILVDGNAKFPVNLARADVNVDHKSIGDIRGADHLAEYDVIIIDYQGPGSWVLERSVQLSEFLDKKQGVLVYGLNRYAYSNNPMRDNYDPIRQILVASLGGQIESCFNTESKGTKFSLTRDGKTGIWKDYLSSKDQSWEIALRGQYADKVVSLATNVTDDIVAFSPLRYKGRLFLLPWLPKQLEQFWLAVIEVGFGTLNLEEAAPEWAEQYVIPTLPELKASITAKQFEIGTLEHEEADLLAQKAALDHLRNTLLAGHGRQLEEAVRSCLISLGLDAQQGDIGEEDLNFRYGDNHFVGEVKGLTNSAGQKDISQLRAKQDSYEEKNPVKTKGALFVNGWRELPLEERDPVQKPVFPNQMLGLARRWNMCLVTTTQLFVAYCLHKDGKFDLEAFVKAVLETDGVLAGYDDLKAYKTPSPPSPVAHASSSAN